MHVACMPTALVATLQQRPRYMQMVSNVVMRPRVVSCSLERHREVSVHLDKLLPFWGETVTSMVDRNPGLLGSLLTRSYKVLLRLAYSVYVHALADRGSAPQPSRRFATSTIVSSNHLWMMSRFPGFEAWAAKKSLSDGVSAAMSAQTQLPQATVQ
jgi:hypothetical protein